MKGEVQVYRNLHKTTKEGQAVYSIRNYKGLVEDHVTEIALIDPKFRVSEKGNRRVRQEGRKNVHAYIQGKRMGGTAGQGVPTGWQQVTYNPYKHEHFVLARDESVDVLGAIMVHIDQTGVWALRPKLRIRNLLEV